MKEAISAPFHAEVQPNPNLASWQPSHHWPTKTPPKTSQPSLPPPIFSTMAESDTQGADYEEQHVHSVYEQIASHFSSTRYKVCVAPKKGTSTLV